MGISEKEQKIFLEKSNVTALSEERLRNIHKKIGERLEAIEDISRKEDLFIKKYEEGEFVYFQLYVCRIKEQAVKKLEQGISLLQKRYPLIRTVYYNYVNGRRFKAIIDNRKYAVTVRDISSRTQLEQRKTINNFIVWERKKKYNPYKMFPININIFKQEEDNFLCFLSLCEMQECKKLETTILHTLFGDSICEKLDFENEIERKGRIQSTLYWKDILKDLPTEVRSVRKYSDKGIATEIKGLSTELSQILCEYAQKNQMKLKVVLMMFWGLILHKYYEAPDLIIGEVSDKGKMSVLPIRMNDDAPIKIQLKKIEEQMKQAHLYDVFSLNELETESDSRFLPCMPVIQNFCELESSNPFIEKIQDAIIYKIRSYELPQVPLCIDYSMDKDVMSLAYSYDKQIYNNNDISQLHENFVMLAREIMHFMQAVDVSETVKIKSQPIVFEMETVIQEKVSYMEKLPLFMGYSLEELVELAKKCSMVDYRMGDVLVVNQLQVEKLYLIMDGKVEVSRPDDEFYLRPLQILKKNGIFGIESLLHNNFSENNYSVYSDTVKLLEIPAEILKEESYKHHGIMQELLEIQSRHLTKFQTLWIMD